MRRVLMIAFATAAIGLGTATTAEAAATLQQCTSGASCVSGTTNVNLGAFTDAPLVTGTVGVGGPTVEFTSDNGLLDTNTGAATIFRSDDGILTQLTFTLLGGAAFTAAEFNLLTGSDSTIDITLTALGGGTNTFSVNNPTGSNVFDIIAGSGEAYTSASFSTTGGGFNTFKQLRLVLGQATPPVPEPATWAMMLLGFGGIGMAMRRRRRSSALMQIA